MSDHDLSQLAGEFPIVGQMAFFNHAGVSPLSPAAAAAVRDYAQRSASHAYVGVDWYRRLRQIKASAATLIGARGAHEIAFIPNTSTGLAIVARGLPWREGDNVVITAVEYPSNRYPWEDLKRFGVELRTVRQQPDGRIEVDDVIDAINDRTRVVSLSHVQYASGHRIDLRAIAEEAHRVPGERGLLCVDAIQSLGALPIDVQAMGVDFLAAAGPKWLLGPEGSGVFYCREDLVESLHPPIVGWMNVVDAHDYGNYRCEFERDARRFEPGTYNIAGTLGLGASIDLLTSVGIDSVWSHIESLTARLCEGLRRKGLKVFSPRADPGERSGIVSWSPPPGCDVKTIAAELEKQGIIIAVREGRLRASPHFYNRPEQIDRLIEALPQA